MTPNQGAASLVEPVAWRVWNKTDPNAEWDGWCKKPEHALARPEHFTVEPLVPASTLSALEAENARLRDERDEARGLVAEANNSLYGSHAYFASLQGGPFNKLHLATGIENIKDDYRSEHDRAETAEQQLKAAREALNNAFDFLGGVDGAVEIRGTILRALNPIPEVGV